MSPLRSIINGIKMGHGHHAFSYSYIQDKKVANHTWSDQCTMGTLMFHLEY